MPIFSVTPFLAPTFGANVYDAPIGPIVEAATFDVEATNPEAACKVASAIHEIRYTVWGHRRPLAVGDLVRVNGAEPQFFRVGRVGFEPMRKRFDMDPSVAFTVLLKLSPAFGNSPPDGGVAVSDFLAGWYNDPSTDMHEFGTRWVARKELHDA